MRIPRAIGKVAVLIGVFAGMAMPAGADIAVEVTNFTDDGYSPNEPSVARFDSTLGTLTGVQISISSEYLFSSVLLDFPYETIPEHLLTISASERLDLIGPGFDLAGNTSISGQEPIGGGPIGGQALYSFNPPFPSEVLAAGDVASGDLGQYIGTGTVDFQPFEYSPNASTDLDNVTAQSLGYGSWSGSITVTYTYVPAGTVAVPEPSTSRLAGTAGILAIGYTLRRRRGESRPLGHRRPRMLK